MKPVFVQPTPVSSTSSRTPQRRTQQGTFAVPVSRQSLANNRNAPRTPRNEYYSLPRQSIVNSVNMIRMEEPQYTGNNNNPAGRMSIIGNLGRFSTAQGSMSGRGSLMAPTGTLRQLPNIPRPATVSTIDTRNNERNSEIKKKIYDYLELFGDELPFQITKNALNHPSTNDFKNLFEFIYRQMDHDFELRRPEEDVPAIMSTLGYPHAIKKMCFTPLGAPFSWPHLLNALDWLIDFVEASRDSMSDYEGKQETPAWAYFITCYKDKHENGNCGNYGETLDTYRKITSGENMDDVYDDLKARRVMHDRDIKKCQEQTRQENEELERNRNELGDLNTDILSLKDWIEQTQVQVARQAQKLEDLDAMAGNLSAMVNKMNEENEQKELLISSQKVSGEEARRLIVNRQNLRSQVSAAREALGNSEHRLYELQPIAQQRKSESRSQYKNFMARLREMSAHLLDAENAAQLNWAIYEGFELGSDEFVTHSHNSIIDLIGRLKIGVEQGIEEIRQIKQRIALAIEAERRKMSAMESTRAQIEVEHSLILEKLERRVEDGARRTDDARRELEVVQEKHQRVKDELQEQMIRLGEVRQRIAEAEKRYIKDKNELSKLYNDVVSALFDKINRLLTKFNVLMDQKRQLKELGERIAEENLRTIEELKRVGSEKL